MLMTSTTHFAVMKGQLIASFWFSKGKRHCVIKFNSLWDESSKFWSQNKKNKWEYFMNLMPYAFLVTILTAMSLQGQNVWVLFFFFKWCGLYLPIFFCIAWYFMYIPLSSSQPSVLSGPALSIKSAGCFRSLCQRDMRSSHRLCTGNSQNVCTL